MFPLQLMPVILPHVDKNNNVIYQEYFFEFVSGLGSATTWFPWNQYIS